MFLISLARSVLLLMNALEWRREAQAAAAVASSQMWTAEAVEAAIDAAGRAEVFAEARRLGWGSGYAPLWVWGQIAREVAARNAPKPTVH